jgi:uncharacterized cofD-like protein
MALAALCGDDDWGRTWAEVVQHRFAGEGDMRGHVIGNLLIVGLWELMGDHVRALDWVGRLLGAQGRVLPMAVTPMDITAEVRGLDAERPELTSTVRGQVEVATTEGDIVSVALDPPSPEACPESVEAIMTADWVFLGPGSWYTSVIPHLMVPRLREALVATSARLVVVLNLEPQEGETPGFGPEDHLAALFEHAPDLKIHTVLADRASVGHADVLERVVSEAGAELVLADVADEGASDRHDHARLAAAFEAIVSRP